MRRLLIPAHAFSAGPRVPVPLTDAVLGATAAVLLAFVVTSTFQTHSVLRGAAAGRAVAAPLGRVVDAPGFRALVRSAGLCAAAYFVIAAGYGSPDTLINPSAGIIYVYFWVGIIPLSLLLGPVWRRLNPLRALHRAIALLAGRPPGQGVLPLPTVIGYWPAAGGLLAFTWLELVAPQGDQPRVLFFFFGTYAITHLIAASVFGSSWFDRADAFEVYSGLAGHLAPFGRRGDGALVVRNPVDGLDAVVAGPGLVAVVCVWLGSTAYDGFSRSNLWGGMLRHALAWHLFGNADEVRTAGLLVVIGMVAGIYLACAWLTAVVCGGEWRALPGQFAHSLVPIAIGYTLAHYFTLALYGSQRTVPLLADPLHNGADLLGLKGFQPDYGILPWKQIGFFEIGAVVLGHTLGVVAAHDRAARLFSRRRAIAGQIPLATLMTLYTFGGLTLLFAQ